MHAIVANADSTPFRKQLLEDCLKDIFEAIDRIERYTAGMSEREFATNELIQDAVILNFRVIGGCSRALGNHLPDFLAAHPLLPGPFAYPFRSGSVPGCYSRNAAKFWPIVKDMPRLRDQLAAKI